MFQLCFSNEVRLKTMSSIYQNLVISTFLGFSRKKTLRSLKVSIYLFDEELKTRCLKNRITSKGHVKSTQNNLKINVDEMDLQKTCSFSQWEVNERHTTGKDWSGKMSIHSILLCFKNF